jgi:hypothetical protein
VYSFRWKFKSVISRLNELYDNKYYHEVLLATLSTIEQLFANTLINLIERTGKNKNQARKIVKEMNGLNCIFLKWQNYDPERRSIYSVIGKDNAECINEIRTMRNKIIHGEHSPTALTCKKKAKELLMVLNSSVDSLKDNYNYFGWR